MNSSWEEVYSERHLTQLFTQCLQNSNKVDLKSLCTKYGIPSTIRPKGKILFKSEVIHHHQVWRIILGLSDFSESSDHFLDLKRKKYSTYAQKHKTDNLSNNDPLFAQINLDVIRTQVKGYDAFFRDAKIQKLLIRLLYVLSKETVDYFQGLSDICIPFLIVFSGQDNGFNSTILLNDELMRIAEADTYFAVKEIMKYIKPCLNDLYSGFLPYLQKMSWLIKLQDPKLGDWLFTNQSLNPFDFGFRWICLLLSRDFNVPCILRLFDFYITLDKNLLWFHTYFCSSLVIYFRDQLITSDYQDLILFLQKLPINNWKAEQVDYLLYSANKLIELEDHF